LPLRLSPGLYGLRAEAENAWGKTLAPAPGSLLIRFKPPPPRLVLEDVKESDAKVLLIRPAGPTLALAAGTAAQGRAGLRGKVTWTEGDTDDLARNLNVVVYVNGSQQQRVKLDKALRGSTERHFKAELVLSKREDNKVKVDLPDLSPSTNEVRTFTVDCLH